MDTQSHGIGVQNFARLKKDDFLSSAVYNKNNYTLNSNYNREHEARVDADGLSYHQPPNTVGLNVGRHFEASRPSTQGNVM